MKRRNTNEGKKGLNPLQTIVIGFSALILFGAFLLMLPISTRSGQSAGFLTSLFTSTSATCVTGLIIEDTYLFWSPFGQAVILGLIQIGGLGFMMVAAGLSLVIGRKITMRERILIGTSLSVDNLSGIVRLAKGIIVATFTFEFLGAAVLAVRFSRDFGLQKGIIKGIWHSVSAFCNAGFDLMGENGAFSSFSAYTGDIVVTVITSFLIIIGGLGFYVWSDMALRPSNGKLSLHTKIVISTTMILLAVGTVGFFIFEYSNPGTLGNESFGTKVLASFFQSTTVRTAGFNQMDQALITPSSQALSNILMFVGGSPGSTAGGIKTATLAVLVMTAIAPFKGKSRTTAFGRTVPTKAVIDALSIFVVALTTVTIGTFIVSFADSLAFEAALFECISAFATVGLSQNLTPTLTPLSHLVLIALMFIGRVGIMTIGVAALMRRNGESKIKLPEGKIMIG